MCLLTDAWHICLNSEPRSRCFGHSSAASFFLVICLHKYLACRAGLHHHDALRPVSALATFSWRSGLAELCFRSARLLWSFCDRIAPNEGDDPSARLRFSISQTPEQYQLDIGFLLASALGVEQHRCEQVLYRVKPVRDSLFEVVAQYGF